MSKTHFPPFVFWLMSHLRAAIFGLGELVRSPTSSFITLIVIGIAVALPSGFYLLLQNFRSLTNQWDGRPTISVYTQMNLAQTQVDQLLLQIQKQPGVKTVHYISPDEGLQEFTKVTQLNHLMDHLQNNPLPGVIVVMPDKAHQTPTGLQQLDNVIGAFPFVDSIQLDRAWIERLFDIITISERVILMLGILFALGVILITGNTIRLIMQSHQQETAIMRLLGATPAFIRRPLLYRGVMYGIFGGIIAWILVRMMLWWLESPMEQLTASYGNSLHMLGLNFFTGFIIIVISCLLALIGAYFAVNQHLSADEVM